MMMASTAALQPTIPSVSGVTTPTMIANPAALVAASVNDASNHNQKDTTFTKIFVGGLPYHTNDKSLREHFEVFGEIDEAVVITDRQTGKSRGYGFVTMADRSGAERAIKDPNPVIDGRKANVNLAYIGAKPRGTPGAKCEYYAPRNWYHLDEELEVRLHEEREAKTITIPMNYSDYASVLTSTSPAAAAAMRLYAAAQFPTTTPHYSYTHAHAAAAGNYLYALQYPYAHPPTALMPTQNAAHLTPSAAAATVGYSPADFAGTAGYTTAGFSTAGSVLDPYTIPLAAGYSYIHAPSAASTFATLGAAGYPTAGSASQVAALQEARMQ